MDRRTFLAALPALAALRGLRAAAGPVFASARLGLASFSCHLHWDAVGKRQPETRFADAQSFFDYARTLGADGVQSGLRTKDLAVARRLRARVEETGGCYEAELKLPPPDGDASEFETEVKVAREAGATVARAVLLSGRRYETFKTADDFRNFRARSEQSLALAEPVVKKHGLRLAIENHKDHTAPELREMLRTLAS